jgi:CIC family chloride channel protein
VVELAKCTDLVLLPEMNVKYAMKMFDDAEAELLAVIESEDSRKVIGFLSESFARRRYVEEIDKATRGVLGALT